MRVRVGSMPTGMNLNRGYRLREGFHIPPRMSIKDTIEALAAERASRNGAGRDAQ